MNKPAAFTATYSDWKLIRSRKVVQIVFEVPVEAADAAYQVVGGMPNAGEEAWFAIARLNADAPPVASAREGSANAVTTTPPANPPGVGQEARAEDASGSAAPPCPPKKRREPQSWMSMSAAQQAGFLCTDRSFQKFCHAENEEAAAEWVRQMCGVTSRSLLPVTSEEWQRIVSDYRFWMREPGLVG